MICQLSIGALTEINMDVDYRECRREPGFCAINVCVDERFEVVQRDVLSRARPPGLASSPGRSVSRATLVVGDRTHDLPITRRRITASDHNGNACGLRTGE